VGLVDDLGELLAVDLECGVRYVAHRTKCTAALLFTHLLLADPHADLRVELAGALGDVLSGNLSESGTPAARADDSDLVQTASKRRSRKGWGGRRRAVWRTSARFLGFAAPTRNVRHSYGAAHSAGRRRIVPTRPPSGGMWEWQVYSPGVVKPESIARSSNMA
jgi:hypothetical protein